MTNAELAKEILRLVGGERNVLHVTNCVTRLRFALKDETKPDTSTIERLDGVLGVQLQGGQYQVILGGKVQKVANELGKIIRISDDVSESSNSGNKNPFMRLIDTLSSILTPVLPPVIAGGMLKGITFMFTNFGWIAGDSDTMIILNLIADCMFYFFPFLLAVSSAKKFKTNEYMALALAGALMYPTIIDAVAAGDRGPFMFLGFIPLALVNYRASVIPIILSVYLLKIVYDFFIKIIPDMVSMIFSPLFTLMIVVPISLAAVAPLGYFAGEYVAMGIKALTDFSPWLAGFLVASTRPLLVIGGMHHAINPIAQQQLATYGYNTISPMSLMSTMAQATAALAAYIIIKDRKTKQIALSATVSGYIGITEPALYGIIVKYKEILWATMLGGGLGAAVATGLGGRCYGFVMPGIVTLPAYMGEGFTGIILGMVVSVVTTFIMILFFAKKINAESANITDGQAEKANQGKNVTTAGEISYILSPAEGTLKPLSEVKDATFAREIVGKGIAIIPNNDEIVAPIDGEVVTCFKTKHAIGLKTANGVEVLLHIGINTVELEGKGFELLVEKGTKVSAGTPLLKVNREAIIKAGYDVDVIVVITNYQDFLQVLPVNEGGVIFKGEQLLSVIK